MLDLEAFDSQDTAIIVSLGAVYFDLKTGKLGEEFYMEVNKAGIEKQYKLGRTFSWDTFIWWMHQSDEARAVFTRNNPERTSIENVLYEFITFCQHSTGNVRIWGNGVNYDNTVLRSCYKTMGIGCPFRYQYDRCYRTAKNQFGNRAKMERVGTHHHGLWDAKSQALHLIGMMEGLNVNE